MDKVLINKYYKQLKHNKFINSNVFLDDILKKVEKNSRNIYNITYNNSKLNIDELDQPEYITSNFISKAITTYIYNNIKYKYNITATYKLLEINLNYYSVTNTLKMDYFDIILKHIILFYNIFGADITKLDISIYDTPFKKHIEGIDTITPSQINSGYSIPYSKQIVIFRKEELMKVLIHELLHVFQFEIREKSGACGMFCDLYSIKTEPFLVNEAIVELYAIIYNSIILSINMYKRVDKTKILEMLNLELDFNLYQTAKILNFSKFNNIEEFLCKCTNKNIMETGTNIISYIIIKTLILFNINKLHNYNVLDNRKLIEQLVARFFKDIKYQNIIDYYMKHIQQHGLIDYNMRMCLFS